MRLPSQELHNPLFLQENTTASSADRSNTKVIARARGWGRGDGRGGVCGQQAGDRGSYGSPPDGELGAGQHR